MSIIESIKLYFSLKQFNFNYWFTLNSLSCIVYMKKQLLFTLVHADRSSEFSFDLERIISQIVN